MDVPETTVVRRQLGRRLKALREAAGKTPADIHAAKLGSKETLWRVETGKVAVRVTTVRSWCAFYGAAADETDALAAMAVGTSQPGWWQEFSDVTPEWFRLYVGLEEGASRIAAWDDSLIPGLLQTAAYARAVFAAALSVDGPAAIDRHVAVRLSRQDRTLKRPRPPVMATVIGEGALARHVGGPDVMAGQLAHLKELATRPNVDVCVLPFDAGAHPAMTGSFTLLDSEGSGDFDVVYVEALVGGRYLEKPGELSRYRATWDKITKQCIPIGEYQ